MEERTIEDLYEEHLKQEPIQRYYKFFKEVNIGIETDEYRRWRMKKENLELVKSIPKEKRIEILNYFKKGNSIGDTTEHFEIKDHMAVVELISLNIEHVHLLRENSL